MGATVKVGHFGDIKKLMKCLSKRDAHVDMEFICGPTREVLKCHRFIIGAQSCYLKSLMLAAETDSICEIFLPEVEKRHMEVVLQFLYTGRLKLQADIINPIRELLVKVLRIDADFKLPCDESLLAANKENDKKDGDSRGGPGAPPSPPSSTDKDSSPPSSDKSNAPPKKRFKPNTSDGQSPTPRNQAVEDSYISPMTPPHVLVHEDEDNDEIVVLPPPQKAAPLVVDLSDDEPVIEQDKKLVTTPKESSAAINEDTCEKSPPASPNPNSEVTEEDEREGCPFRNLELPPAPRVIAKRTAPPVDFFSKKFFAKKSAPPIIRAPKVVAKSTGAPFKKKPGRPPKKSQSSRPSSPFLLQPDHSQPSSSTDVVSESAKNSTLNSSAPQVTTPVMEQEQLILPAANGQSYVINFHEDNRATRSKTGAIQRTSFAELFDDDHDAIDNAVDNDFLPNVGSPAASSDVSEASLLELPPPIPEPPEPGLVLYRGEWMKREKKDKLKTRTKMHKNANKSIRRYHPNLFTITGRTLPETSSYRNETDGEHPCHLCNAVFARKRSLLVHYGREHNPNAKYPCPEPNCGKKLTTKTAIKKHLLSHRPREQWPFMCEFCGRRFQALSDVPKHYKTSAHINDARIPKLGTPEWIELMKRAEVLPWRARSTSVSHSVIADPGSPSTSVSHSMIDPGSPSSLAPEAPSPPPTIEVEEDAVNRATPAIEDHSYVRDTVISPLDSATAPTTNTSVTLPLPEDHGYVRGVVISPLNMIITPADAEIVASAISLDPSKT